MSGKDKKTEYGFFFSDKFAEVFKAQIDGLKSEKSRKNYMAFVTDICSYAGKDFPDISREDIISYFDSISCMSSNYRTLRFSVLRSVAKNTDANLGTNIIIRYSGIPKADRQKMEYKMSDLPKLENVDRVMALLVDESKEADREDTSRQLLTILQLALETGLSSSKISELTYDNMRIDDPSGLPLIHYEPVIIREDENGETIKTVARNIPISADLAMKINECGAKNIRRNQLPYIFRNEQGGRLSERSLEMYIHSACARAGLIQEEDGKKKDNSFSLQDIRNLVSAQMKAGGATDGMLALQLGVTDCWFSRLCDVSQELKNAAGNYNHIKVVW